MLRLAQAGLSLAIFATFSVSSWSFWQSPLVAPYRDRTEAELSVALEAALGRELTMRAVDDRISAALANGEPDEAAAVLRLADLRDVTVRQEQRDQIAAAEEAASGWSACAACAFDPEACPDLTRVAACNLPLELTPVGDVKAIYRGLDAYVAGDDVDRIDLTLGVVGLVSTAAIVTSGGSSLTVKAGAATLRVARKTGALARPLADEIAALATDVLRLDQAPAVLAGTADLRTMINPQAAARLSAVAGDVGRLTDTMPLGDALAVLRYVDNTDDLARVARVAVATKGETRATMAVLGKARVLRLTTRLTDIALLVGALILALFGQVLTFILWFARRTFGFSGQRRIQRPVSARSRHHGPRPR